MAWKVTFYLSEQPDLLKVVDFASREGLKFMADSMDSSVVADRTKGGARPTKSSAPGTSAGVGSSTWATFLTYLTNEQVDVLRCIKENAQGVTSAQIGDILNRQRTSVTGSLGGGLRKNIPKAGFTMTDIIVTEDGPDGSIYKPGPTLLKEVLPKQP